MKFPRLRWEPASPAKAQLGWLQTQSHSHDHGADGVTNISSCPEVLMAPRSAGEMQSWPSAWACPAEQFWQLHSSRGWAQGCRAAALNLSTSLSISSPFHIASSTEPSFCQPPESISVQISPPGLSFSHLQCAAWGMCPESAPAVPQGQDRPLPLQRTKGIYKTKSLHLVPTYQPQDIIWKWSPLLNCLGFPSHEGCVSPLGTVSVVLPLYVTPTKLGMG